MVTQKSIKHFFSFTNIGLYTNIGIFKQIEVKSKSFRKLIPPPKKNIKTKRKKYPIIFLNQKIGKRWNTIQYFLENRPTKNKSAHSDSININYRQSG